MTFGEYIREQRLKSEIALREVGRQLNLSAAYLCDMEHDKRNPPAKDVLDRLATLYKLDPDHLNRLYDIAGEERNCVPLDLTEYILENSEIKVVLRIAQDKKLRNEDWKKIRNFIEKF